MTNIVCALISLICSPLFSAQLGSITHFNELNNEFVIQTADGAITKIIFYQPDIFRIWVGPDGNLIDPAGKEETPIVVYTDSPISVIKSEENDYYKLETQSCILRIYKNPCMFSLYKKDNETLLFKEVSPIIYGKNSHQSLEKNDDDYFYGCGMQNGHFCHNNRTIQIENIYDDKQNIWNENGTPNAASFYMSLKGYGVFRNTYAAGTYKFNSTVTTMHNENRFDAYYFTGNLKEILNGYTTITGRPFLTPQWGLEFGDADRYNDGSYECVKFADEYIDRQIPVGWFLPNDGYNMDFSRVPEVSEELSKRGIMTGMWTDKKLDFKKYVTDYNIRLFKLDIAWVGAGTKFSMNACNTVYHHIEDNADVRGLIWTTLGWSGNHRYSIMWTGDNGYKEPDDWIRWHIPTLIGSGLSAQNGATGDIDGIFGGSADRYVRDLQWKTFTTNMMIIDNWKVAGEEWKKPWSYGEPYTSYNRQSLKLKSRLMPYLYTYSHKASTTGVPVVRACVLEFPNDPKTWDESGENGATKHQFMCGNWLMVVPVYKTDGTEVWSFYLPKGKWTDFFTGKEYNGEEIITGYNISDFKFPVLVRDGGIIPMYPHSYYDDNRFQQKPRDPLTLDIYPSEKEKTFFELIEDDGLTYKFKTESLYNKTLIICDPISKPGTVIIEITGQYEGNGYTGMPEKRNYYLTLHGRKPQNIFIEKDELTEMKKIAELNNMEHGWYFEAGENITHIKVKTKDANSTFSVIVFRGK